MDNNNDMSLFSIIVPVYNVEEYLRQCLDSVLSQTFPDYECILVDDGSPDNCPAICDEYTEKDFRFKVIHKVNGGLSDARNVGIQKASGEYIILLDSDDLFADYKALENLWNIIETTKSDVIYNSNLTTFKDDTFTSSDEFDKDFICGDIIQFYKGIKLGKNLAAWSFALHRNFLLHHDLFFKTGIVHEDEHWVPRVICATSTVAVNHNLFYAYRLERPGAITTTLTQNRLFDMISIIEDISSWLKIRDIKAFHRQVYVEWGIHLLIFVFYQIALLSTDYYQDKIPLFKKLKKSTHLLLRKMSVNNFKLFLLINFIYSNHRGPIFHKNYLNFKRKIICR